jgi:hypothetical protein
VPADAAWHTQVLTAWRADTVTRRFRSISTTGLRCRNDAWGVD